MKRNVLVVDPSIMIHKIVQLAFPEEQYDVIISNNYPLENEPEGNVYLALISADLPGHDDVLETALTIKKSYDCPILLMIPKFHDPDSRFTQEAGVNATIEKPFTSDALKERVAGLAEVPGDLDDMESLSQEELDSITDDEFMLSEEDLMDIGEEDLADVEIPEDLPAAVEPDTEELSEDQPEPVAEPEPEVTDPGQGRAEEPPLLDSEEEEAFGDFEEEVSEVEMPEESADASEPTGDMPFDDMEIEDDLDSIDFGDLGDEDQLLTDEALNHLPQAAAPGESEEPEPAFDLPLEAPEESEAAQSAPQTDFSDPEVEPAISEEPTPEPDEIAQEEAAPVTDEEDIDVNFAIEDEPRTMQLDEYEVETPVDEEPMEMEKTEETETDEEPEPEPIPEALDLSHAEEDHEVIHPPSSLSGATSGAAALSDTDIEKIAQRVVDVLGREALKEVAWEVIPVVAEEVVRSRIRELEQEQD